MSLSKSRRWSERTRMPLTVRLAVVSITMEEAGLRDVVKRALQGCPEEFSKLYASHCRHVLWVCRRFFWRPEDPEDAAPEVFLT